MVTGTSYEPVRKVGGQTMMVYGEKGSVQEERKVSTRGALSARYTRPKQASPRRSHTQLGCRVATEMREAGETG